MSNRPTRKPSASQRVHEAHDQASNRRLYVIGGVVVLVVLFVVVVVTASRGGSGDVAGGGESPSGGTVVPAGNLSYGTVQVAGAPLPPATPGQADAIVGEAVPTVTGQQFDGAAIEIAPDGRPKIVMGVAHWCPHCQAEVPVIQEWLDDNGMPTDVDLYAVSTSASDAKPNYPPGDWLRGEGWSVPTLVDDQKGSAAAAIGLANFPYFLVVDGDGNVVMRTSGEQSTQAWEAMLEAARTGSVSGGSAPAGPSSP